MTDQPPYGHPAPPWQPPAPSGPPLPPAHGQGHPYAAPAYAAGGPPRVGDGPWGPLATWGTRVGAMLIDTLVGLVGMVPYVIGFVLIVTGSPESLSSDAPTAPSTSETNTGGRKTCLRA